MKLRHKKRAMVGIPLGLILFGCALFLSIERMIPAWARVATLLFGLIIYIWGCLSLARAKGYSSAIILTVILGVLFPAVLLLVLPDKHQQYEKRR